MGIPHGEGYTLISHKIDYFINKVCFFGFRDSVSKLIFDSLWDKQSYLFPDLGFLTKKYNEKKTNEILLQKKLRIPSNFIKLTPRDYEKISASQFDLLYKKLSSKNYNVKFLNWKNFNDAICEIAKSQWIVTNNLHAGIIALTQATPFSALSYQGKINDVLGIVANKERIIYPNRIYEVERFIPPLAYSQEEKQNLSKIQNYLKKSLLWIKKGIENNELESSKMDDFPIKTAFEYEKYVYGRVKAKTPRRIINHIKKLYASRISDS
ncbi:MAG: hypothetical protein AC479_08410 [miscellaneous Crenarchaeota group-6 archaeon AD8-1]|nr:MAG: hypothetical protein AC479_08410 [miscellaneous Crenarchaeota group-6 archaeon AD8-1]